MDLAQCNRALRGSTTESRNLRPLFSSFCDSVVDPDRTLTNKLSHELVPNSMHGKDMGRLICIRLDLLAQLRDMIIDSSC